MSVHIDVLNTDLLKYIFGFLEDKQLFVIEVVNKKWQRCVRQLMARKTALKRLDYYSIKFVNLEFDKHGFIIDEGFIFIDDNINILKKILTKCPNIKRFDLLDRVVSDDNNLLVIALLCPKLERIHLIWISKIVVTEYQMNEFA